MSQQIDSKIIELAKKWGLRFISYAELISDYHMEEWVVLLSFIRALLNECTIVGRRFDNVYLRCDGKLVMLRTAELHNYSKSVKVVEDEVRRIQQIKIIDIQEVEKMEDNLPAVDINFIKPDVLPLLTVFGNETIYLMNLGDVPLYLEKIYILPSLEDFRFGIVVHFPSRSGIGVMDVTFYVQKDGTARYLGKSTEKIARETILRAIPHESGRKEDEIVEEGIRMILDAVGKKISIIDKMLEDAEDIFIKGLKELTAVFLY